MSMVARQIQQQEQTEIKKKKSCTPYTLTNYKRRKNINRAYGVSDLSSRWSDYSQFRQDLRDES